MKEMVKAPERAEKKDVRFGPFDELLREMERSWGIPLGFPGILGTGGMPEAKAAWMPRIDVFEQEGEFVVRADLPGVEKKDVQVTVTEDQLEIRGERRQDKQVYEMNLQRSECEYGSFQRRLALGFEPDPGLVVAKFAGGVLEVRIPIPAEKRMEPKKIAIS